MAEARWRTWARQLSGLQPLTATGAATLLTGLAAAALMGWWREDRVLLVVGLGAIALVMVGAIATALGAALLYRQARSLSSPPIRLQVGTPALTGFQLTLPLLLPLIDARWQTLDPRVQGEVVRRGRSLQERWTPHRRGEHALATRWLLVGDVFGLTEVGLLLRVPTDIRFSPSEGALRRVEVVRGLSSGDRFAHPEGQPRGDLQDMRRYGAGDPIRYVLWKVFARSRALVVRTPERALSPIRRTAAYLVTGPADQAAAGTALTAATTGALGEVWSLGADGTALIATDRPAVLPLLLASATSPEQDAASGLEAFLAAVDTPDRVVLFIGATEGPWVARVLALAARGVRMQLILCVDRVVSPPRALQRVSSALLLPRGTPACGVVDVDRDALASLCKRLQSAGELRVVERQTGTVYAGAHIERLHRMAG